MVVLCMVVILVVVLGLTMYAYKSYKQWWYWCNFMFICGYSDNNDHIRLWDGWVINYQESQVHGWSSDHSNSRIVFVMGCKQPGVGHWPTVIKTNACIPTCSTPKNMTCVRGSLCMVSGGYSYRGSSRYPLWELMLCPIPWWSSAYIAVGRR